MCEFDVNNLDKKDNLKNILNSSLRIIKEYEWLINSYVLDFFVEDHWEKLPTSWRNIENLNPEKLCELLEEENNYTSVWPLSILSLKTIIHKLTVSRKQKKIVFNTKNALFPKTKVRNKFEKGIKLKKRHEITCMSEITQFTALRTGTKYIVDFGAGLGHFARILSYGYDLKICCLEMQESLNENARMLDQQFEDFLCKNCITKIDNKPEHVSMKLSNSTTAEMFKNEIRKAFNLKESQKFTFGIVGLHPCGDLASILIRMFLQCEEAKFLNLVGCCYMKLTQNYRKEISGYPLSSFLKYDMDFISSLSYECREIACHAIEKYSDRLKCGNYTELKVHAYRAVIEEIIIKKYPDKKHIGLRNIKITTDLDFIEYCEIATKGTEIDVIKNINNHDVNVKLSKWKNIVIFYTLRLFFAPLIETIILYDRVLYLMENGCEVNIEAICDPYISPRNHITTAIKPL